MRNQSRGFTLVEILIVVIILGILAAIVIPQFTNASNDARTSSVTSTLQTMRSQIELYKIQHADTPPAVGSLSALLTAKTDALGAVTTATTGFGPYVQSFPVNPLNGFSTVVSAAGTAAGWVYTVVGGQYTVQATDTTGTGAMANY